MAATVVIAETNGPQGSETESIDPINLNFGSVDDAALDPSAHPITAQADGHSFEKWVRLYVSDMGSSSIVDNFKVWLSNLGGGFGTGEGISTNARESGYTPAAYPVAGPVETDSAVATLAMPETEPAGPNLGISGTLPGQISTGGSYSDWLVLQLDVSESTPAGSLNQKTFTFQWDEQ